MRCCSGRTIFRAALACLSAMMPPLFDAAVREILRRARARGVGAGIHSWMGVPREIAWAREAGMNFLIHSADIIARKEKLSSEIGELRAALGDVGAGGNSRPENI